MEEPRPAVRTAPPARFHVIPSSVRWHKRLRLLGKQVLNELSWGGELESLVAPSSPCWLLPAKDEVALRIARHRAELQAAGWKLLTCDERVLLRLSDKCQLREHAASLGLLAHLPQHYASLHLAAYPCVLKRSVGAYGRNVHIVSSAAHALQLTAGWCADECGALREGWLLQELIGGRVECSASLLVSCGEILRALVTEYTFAAEAYVWPRVKEERARRATHEALAPRHREVLSALLVGFSGVCNVNYKLQRGELRIFEVNTRLGGDLASDARRDAAAAFFEAIDALPSASASPSPSAPPPPPPRAPFPPPPPLAHTRSLPVGEPSPRGFQPSLHFFPPAPPAARGVAVLVVPGGGLRVYNAREAAAAARHLASRGYRTYVLRYSHAAVGGSAAAAHADAVAAVAALRREEAGAHLHAVGFSAGGGLVLGACGGGAHTRPDSVAFVYGCPPAPLRLDAGCPPVFLFATAADRLCPHRSCHEPVVRALQQLRVRHTAVVWPNVWNDDDELRALVYKHARYAHDNQHGQGVGLLVGKYPEQVLHVWSWVREMEEWMAEQERRGRSRSAAEPGGEQADGELLSRRAACERDVERWMWLRTVRGLSS